MIRPSTARARRKVYIDPITLWREDRTPREELPSQVRPPSVDPPPRRPRADLDIDGQAIAIAWAWDRHQPGIGAARRRILDLHPCDGGPILARISTYPDGPRCSCARFAERRACPHLKAVVLAGYIPEIGQLVTWAPVPEGGPG